MPDAEKFVEDVLLEPLETALFRTGRGISESQLELDKNSLATQILIDNNKDLTEAGIKATWYHFPEAHVELKMCLSLHGIVEKREGKTQVVRLKMFSAPMNATYKNTFDYDVTGSSTIRAKIVSIPVPSEVKGT